MEVNCQISKTISSLLNLNEQNTIYAYKNYIYHKYFITQNMEIIIEHYSSPEK
jgi:hypothetical protein